MREKEKDEKENERKERKTERREKVTLSEGRLPEETEEQRVSDSNGRTINRQISGGLPTELTGMNPRTEINVGKRSGRLSIKTTTDYYLFQHQLDKMSAGWKVEKNILS